MHTGDQIEQFRRVRQPPEQLHLLTMKWIISLPEYLRPVALAKQFPRIANDIALLQADKEACVTYLAKLVFDLDRPDRSGFPLPIASEIIELHSYFSAP